MRPPPTDAGRRDRLRELELEQARLLDELRRSERRLRTVARSVWRVQEEERRRLARELHDGLGQTLTALRLRLDQLRLDAVGRDPGLAGQLAEVWEVAGSALAEAREMARLLRPPILDEMGFTAALAWLARRFEGAGLAVALEVRGLEQGLDEDLEIAVFRLAQEALNNAAKHSGARAARLSVVRDGAALRFACDDEGQGFAVDTVSGGFGLRAMRDRVESFGGSFDCRSSPGVGTEIRATVPLEEARPAGEAR